MPEKLVAGRLGPVIVSMGIPRLSYGFFYRSHSLTSFERNILGFPRFLPVRHLIIGPVRGNANHAPAQCARNTGMGLWFKTLWVTPPNRASTRRRCPNPPMTR